MRWGGVGWGGVGRGGVEWVGSAKVGVGCRATHDGPACRQDGGAHPTTTGCLLPTLTRLPVEGDEPLQVGMREYLRGEIGRALLPQVLEGHAAVRRRRLVNED